MQAAEDDEKRNKECRQSETPGYEEVGENGADAAAYILEALFSVLNLAWSQCRYQTLICLSRTEIAEKRYRQIDGEGDEDDAVNKVGLVVDDIIDANGFAEAF